MKTKLQKNTLLAICCADLMLLAACGGGGGGNGGMVRNDPPIPVQTTPPPPPPPPPPRTLELPAPPQTTATPPAPTHNAGTQDYLINLVGTGATSFLNGVSTAGSLTKQGDGRLYLNGITRFDEGTRLESGSMELWGDLHSDLSIAAGANFAMGFGGTIIGDVDNHGVFEATDDYYTYYDAEIFGDYSQSAEGMLRVMLGLQGTTPAQPLLTVSGTATLDGSLQFQSSGFIPAAGYLEWVVHARDGIIGRFADWSTSGSPLFITGELRHEANDVYLLASRISAQAVMANTGDALTAETASRIDGAFEAGDRLAALPHAALSDVQRRFLQSASSIQNIRDYGEAIRIFDSLSGHAHAMAQDALHAQSASAAAQLDGRLQLIRRGTQGGAWASPLRAVGGLGSPYSTEGRASGYDLWLAPQWLIGSSLSRNQGRMQLERMGGDAQGESPTASIYAHYRGARWHATGLVGAGRTTLQLDRPIDLGAAGMHVAHSRRELGQAFVHGELGRRVLLGKGLLTPFVAVDYSALHSDSFSEQGDTGFELVAQPGRSNRLSAAAGTRYTRDWIFGGNGWLQLNLDARYQRRLHDGGDAQQAAFLGVPDAAFDLTSWPQADYDATLELGLLGGFGERWTWSADYARRFGIGPGNGGWFLGLRRDF